MSICWLVDELLSERAYETGYPSIADVAIELGHRVYKTKYIPLRPYSDPMIGMTFPVGACVVTHGTVQFCKQIEKDYRRRWTPGMYFNEHVKNFSKFAPHIEDLLNDDYFILPYAELIRRTREALHGSCFIKPESGLKEFVGQVICGKTLDDDLSKLSPHGPIDPSTLCVFASVKDIKAEFRYVIVDKKVITGSEYRWDDVLDVRRDTHPICDALAKKVAEAEWQADVVYICDIALIEQNNVRGGDLCIDQMAKVIELNAFSSSGLYACDTYKIVEAVSEAAEREHSGV